MLTIDAGGTVDSDGTPQVQEGFYCLNLKADMLFTSIRKKATMQTAFPVHRAQVRLHKKICGRNSGRGNQSPLSWVT